MITRVCGCSSDVNPTVVTKSVYDKMTEDSYNGMVAGNILLAIAVFITLCALYCGYRLIWGNDIADKREYVMYHVS